MNGPSYFEIQADDTKRASDFYRGVFGWKFAKASLYLATCCLLLCVTKLSTIWIRNRSSHRKVRDGGI
jgi:hypothetical protein